MAESTSDPNSYGFRLYRSTHDAIEQCFNALARKTCAEWILEADIKACFDRISHEWLLHHVVMDCQTLSKWLKAGYLKKQKLYPTEEGTPQGGILSPTLANIALNGLEAIIKAAAGKNEKVNTVRYADDFIVTAASQEALTRLKTVIVSFLAERGLELASEKTKITSIYHGFDFLGFNIRKYRQHLLIKPSKTSLQKIRETIRRVAHENVSTPTFVLIKQLNPKLVGWGNYYRHVVSSRAFAAVDHEVFLAVWRWARRRHPKKSSTWIRHQYFRRRANRSWVFYTNIKDDKGKKKPLDVAIINSIRITRHVKIKSHATPYDPTFKTYFEDRRQRNKRYSSSSGYWKNCIAPTFFH